MNGDEDGEIETAAEPVEAAEATSPDPTEVKARDMGWQPRDKWKGEPDKWKPADEFVRRGEEVLPFVQKENRELKAKLASLEKNTATTIARIERMSALGLQKQREQLAANWEAEKDRRVELGDTKGYKAVDAAQKAALRAFDAEAAPAADVADIPDKEVIEAWTKANPWFTKSPMLRGAADEVFDELSAEMPGASMEERLAETRARVASQFPDKFGVKKGNGASRVEGSNGRGANGGDPGGELWGRVPSEARAMADRMIREERLFDPPGKKKGEALSAADLRAAREAYAREYLS